MRLAIIYGLCVLLMSCNKDESDGNNISNLSPIDISKKETVSFNNPEELISYVNSSENGYYKEKEIDELKFSSLLKPIDFIKATQILKGSDGIAISDSDNLQYFDLRIEIKNFSMEFLKYKLGSPQDYSHRVNYCSFQMQDDIYLIDGNDTLPCVFYHFERSFDVVPFGHFILAFNPTKGNNIKSKTLVYYDRLFNKGVIKFTFLPDDLIKVPTLIKT